jgi:general secretion pathway protein H
MLANQAYVKHLRIKRGCSAGFTLIEILVVVLIIGITTSFVMLSFGDFGEKRKIINAAQQFADYVTMVKKEAILESNTLSIKIKGHRYDVLRFKSPNKWRHMSETIFKNQHFPKQVNVYLTINKRKSKKSSIIVNPSGDITPFELKFGKTGNKIIATVTGESDGSVVVKSP